MIRAARAGLVVTDLAASRWFYTEAIEADLLADDRVLDVVDAGRPRSRNRRTIGPAPPQTV